MESAPTLLNGEDARVTETVSAMVRKSGKTTQATRLVRKGMVVHFMWYLKDDSGNALVMDQNNCELLIPSKHLVRA